MTQAELEAQGWVFSDGGALGETRIVTKTYEDDLIESMTLEAFLAREGIELTEE